MPNITDFINAANAQITGQGINQTATTYRQVNDQTFDNLEVEISFGIGRATSIPWIAFLGYNQKVQRGIYANPSNGSFKVHCENNEEIKQIALFTMDNKLVYSMNYSGKKRDRSSNKICRNILSESGNDQ